MALYAIGDIQGCARELDHLLNAIDFSPSRDELWLVGDLVNRGDHSLAVLKRIQALEGSVHVVLGNHDLHCLAVGFKVAALRKSDTFSDILEDADCNKWLNWLLHQPLMHENEHWVMVHAAVPPQWTLDQLRQETNAVHHALQADPAKFLKEMYGNEPTRWSNDLHPIDRYRFTVNALTRMRYVSDSSECLSAPKGPPSDAPKELTPWYLVNRTALGKRIVFGHWSALGLYEDSQVLCLDTGCAWGQVLSAKRLDANEPVIQVPCIGPGKSFT